MDIKNTKKQPLWEPITGDGPLEGTENTKLKKKCIETMGRKKERDGVLNFRVYKKKEGKMTNRCWGDGTIVRKKNNIGGRGKATGLGGNKGGRRKIR